jgi:hypothetical protein
MREDVEGVGCGQFQGTVTAFFYRKPQKILVMQIAVSADY